MLKLLKLKGFPLSYLKVIQLELGGYRRFFSFLVNKKKKKKDLNHSLIDLMILSIYLIDAIILDIYRTLNHFSRAVRGENFLYVSTEGSFFSIAIPMSRLSNRCNWYSIPKRRKRSSESGFLWSSKKSNLFNLNVPAILHFLEKGAQPTRTVHDILSKGGYRTSSLISPLLLFYSYFIHNSYRIHTYFFSLLKTLKIL